MGGVLRPSLRFTRTRVSINVCRGVMRIHHVWQGSSKCAQQVAQRVAQQKRDAESPALESSLPHRNLGMVSPHPHQKNAPMGQPDGKSRRPDGRFDRFCWKRRLDVHTKNRGPKLSLVPGRPAAVKIPLRATVHMAPRAVDLVLAKHPGRCRPRSASPARPIENLPQPGIDAGLKFWTVRSVISCTSLNRSAALPVK